MGKLYHLIEEWVDRLIFPAILLLLVVIIIEFFFQDFAEHYHTWILIADYSIIALFSLDLLFKYRRVRNFQKFVRSNWLDIIAVFPFILFFRVFETALIFTELGKELKNVQLVFHESLELAKGTSKLVKEAEAAGKISRVKAILRTFESLQRSPRLVKAVSFYEKPSGGKKLGKEQYKQVKKIEKKMEKIVIGKPLDKAKKLVEKK
jgi:hypothetical protein